MALERAADARASDVGRLDQHFRLRRDFSFAGFSPQTQVVLTAMQMYGLILADNGANWFFQGSADGRWSDQLIGELKRIPAGAFEAIDGSSLMLDPNSSRVTPAARNQGLKAGWHSTWQGQSDYLIMQPGSVASFWIRFSNDGTETWQRGIWGRQANLGLNGDNKAPYRLGMGATGCGTTASRRPPRPPSHLARSRSSASACGHRSRGASIASTCAR